MSVADRLQITQTRLNAYYEAELAVLSGQAYTIGSRSLTRANLAEVKKAIKDLENLVDELQAKVNGGGRRKVFQIIPVDR